VTPETHLAALEARYGVNLPAHFRQYLRKAAPMSEKWDENDGTWWPFARIKNIPEEFERPVGDTIQAHAAKHLFFPDFSDWCCAWAISCADDDTYGKIAIIWGTPDDGYIADSFGEFVTKYTGDFWSIA
jgi:hypothetical protein